MVTLTSVEQIRSQAGVGTEIVSDETIKVIMNTVQNKTADLLGIHYEPVKTIEILNGSGNLKQKLNRSYPLKIISLTVGETAIDMDDIHLDYLSRLITVESVAGITGFPKIQNYIKAKYLNAFMSKTKRVTETVNAETSGDSVEVEVDSVANIIKNDWIMIEGTDKKREVAKVTAVNATTNTLTLDNLAQDHIAESLIIKMQPHQLVKDYVLYESAVSVGINATGSSYTFNTGYSLGPLSTQKGVPFSHFQKNVADNIKLRDVVLKAIRNKLSSIV